MSSRSLSSRFFWRPVAGALLLSVPALVLVPGCGGGGSNNIQYYTLKGVEILNGNSIVSRGNLSVTFGSPSTSPQSAAGYLQILDLQSTPTATTTGTPNATTTTSPTTAATQTVAFKAKKISAVTTRALPNGFIPASALYQIRGTALVASSTSAPVVTISGAFAPRQNFTITGTVATDEILTLTANFTESDGQTSTGELKMKVLQNPFPTTGTSTPVPTGTPLATGTPTTTGTPSGTTTATPFVTTTPTFFATPTQTSTTAPINTPGPL